MIRADLKEAYANSNVAEITFMKQIFINITDVVANVHI